MAIDTIKFSEFTSAGDISNDKITVGLDAGANVRFNNPWTFLAEGTTGDRPAPQASMYYRLRFNTTLESYEFYDPTSVAWVQIEDSGDISDLIARLAAHTAGDGASMIGLEDQVGVSNKTVQDLAEAGLIAKTTNGTLTNGQFLADLTTGALKSTTGTGELSISAPLTSIDGLSTAADKMIYTTASNVYATTDLTSFARTLLDDANAATAAATMAVLPLAGGTMVGNVSLDGTYKITNAIDPTSAQDYATKAYVDAAASLVHEPAIAATTANLAGYVYDNGTAGVGATLTAGGVGAFSTDGVSPAQDARILVWQQTAGAENGVYTLSTVGDGATAAVLTRATDYDTASDMQAGDTFTVLQGTLYGVSEFVMTQTAAITVGTTDITFAERSVSGALLIANNLSDVASDVTSRQNLGVEIGVDVQAYDAGLQSISGLTTAADKMIYTTALDTYAVSDLSSFARTVLDDTTAGAARTTLDAQEDLSGATLTAATVATGDKVLIQDVDDSDNLKTVTVQSIVDLAGVPVVIAAHAYESGATTLDPTAITKIALNSTSFNVGSAFDTTNQWFLPNRAGLYQVNFQVLLNTVATKSYNIQLWKNGAVHILGNQLSTSTSQTQSYNGSAFVELNGTTDYLELKAYNGDSSSTVTTVGAPYTFMSVSYIGPTS